MVSVHVRGRSAALARHASRMVLDQRGGTAIEYALIAFFLSISIGVVIPAIGLNIGSIMEVVAGLF